MSGSVMVDALDLKELIDLAAHVRVTEDQDRVIRRCRDALRVSEGSGGTR